MEITIITEKLFTVTDFPPVALLREKTSPAFVNKITEYLDGADGVNENPMFVESFINFYRNQSKTSANGETFEFDFLVSGVSEEYKKGANFFLQQGLISEDFLTHSLRFSRDINKILDWALVVSTGSSVKPLLLEDSYYITSFINTLSIITYNQLVGLCNNSRPTFESIRLYNELKLLLHEGKTSDIYSAKDIFTVAPLYTPEEVINLVDAGHTLLHIILFNRLGLTTASDVLENGHTIPREWLEVVKSQYV